MIDETMGQRINDLLIEKDISQKELAKYCNCGTATISDIVKDKDKGFDYRTLRSIAECLDVSLDYLVGLSDISSADPDIQEICQYTGLSVESINNLHSSTYQNETRHLLSYLFSNELFDEFFKMSEDAYLSYEAYSCISDNFSDINASSSFDDIDYVHDLFMKWEEEAELSLYKSIKKYIELLDRINQYVSNEAHRRLNEINNLYDMKFEEEELESIDNEKESEQNGNHTETE